MLYHLFYICYVGITRYIFAQAILKGIDMANIKEKVGGRYGLNRYVVLVILLSFLGWCFETLYVYMQFECWGDSGFMSLPFCPIYGCTLTAVYFLAGTPHQPRGIMQEAPSKTLRYVLYFVVAFLLPTVMEYIVGAFFYQHFHIRLWSYNTMPYNVNGYVCLPVSLAWAGLIFVFMRYAFLPLKNWVGKTSDKIAWGLVVILGIVFIVDTAYNVYKILA